MKIITISYCRVDSLSRCGANFYFQDKFSTLHLVYLFIYNFYNKQCKKIGFKFSNAKSLFLLFYWGFYIKFKFLHAPMQHVESSASLWLVRINTWTFGESGEAQTKFSIFFFAILGRIWLFLSKFFNYNHKPFYYWFLTSIAHCLSFLAHSHCRKSGSSCPHSFCL